MLMSISGPVRSRSLIVHPTSSSNSITRRISVSSGGAGGRGVGARAAPTRPVPPIWIPWMLRNTWSPRRRECSRGRAPVPAGLACWPGPARRALSACRDGVRGAAVTAVAAAPPRPPSPPSTFGRRGRCGARGTRRRRSPRPCRRFRRRRRTRRCRRSRRCRRGRAEQHGRLVVFVVVRPPCSRSPDRRQAAVAAVAAGAARAADRGERERRRGGEEERAVRDHRVELRIELVETIVTYAVTLPALRAAPAGAPSAGRAVLADLVLPLCRRCRRRRPPAMYQPVKQLYSG